MTAASIAGVFYRAGIIEKWGTGTLNILDWCAENGNPAPAWAEGAGSVVLSFTPAATGRVAGETKGEADAPAPHDTPHDTPHDAPHVIAILRACKNAVSRPELQEILGLADREHFRKRYLLPALDAGLIERTIPDKPKSKNQKYLLTKKGETLLKEMEEISK